MNALNLLMLDIAFIIAEHRRNPRVFVYFLVCGKRMDTKPVASDDEC